MALFFYTRKIVANFDFNTEFNKPKILASNHPNSFFDAIVIAVNYPKPIYFLARGDAFKNKKIAAFLKSIHLIPIYRLSEGKENLSKNDETFTVCINLLKNNETILIFSEGLCVNEWRLRNLKKGTARLAFMALQSNLNALVVQPVNLNYSSFSSNPKDVLINFNKSIVVKRIESENESDFYKKFNLKLKDGLLDKMILKNDNNSFRIFDINKNYLQLLLFAIPALIGYLTQYWIYDIIKRLTLKKTKNTVFYDSVLFGMLLIFYPIIVFLLSVSIGILINYKIGLFLALMLPATAYSYTRFKSNL